MVDQRIMNRIYAVQDRARELRGHTMSTETRQLADLVAQLGHAVADALNSKELV